MANDRVQRLQKYAAMLQQRLADAVPAKRAGQAAEFKQMLEIDLKKTLSKIEALRK